MDTCIESTVRQYALPVYIESFLVAPSNYEDIALNINDDLFYSANDDTRRNSNFFKTKTRLAKEKDKEILQQIENAQLEHFVPKQIKEPADCKNIKYSWMS